MLFSARLLSLAVHVPASCSTFPAGAELAMLRDAGVSAIIADGERAAAASVSLPIVNCAADANELTVDGSSWLWLRGHRSSLLERAAELPRRADFIASLPDGGAVSESALQRSCTLAWQLRSAHGCRAVVLPWAELEAAAATEGSGGWEGVTAQLTRMQNPTWTVIQGG